MTESKARTYAIAGGRADAQRLSHQAEFMAKTSESFLASIGLAEGWDCVDVGCGNGTVTLAMARVAGPAARVVGFDLDEQALELARAAAKEAELAIEFAVHDCSEPVERDAFDLAYARIVLSHLPDPEGALAAMRDSVRPGGAVAAEDLRADTLESDPPSEALVRLRKIYIATIRSRGEDPLIGSRLPSMFESAGLEDVDEHVVVNPVKTEEEKHTLVDLVTNMREAMIAAGAATAAELDELSVELDRVARDPNTLVHQAHIHQVSGRRPGG